MDTFDSAWETSFINFWTIVYTSLIVLGIYILARLSTVPTSTRQRLITGFVVLIFSYAAAEASNQSVIEKWQVRHEWSAQNWDRMSELEKDRSVADGANLLMEPILGGAFAFGCFITTVFVATSFCRVKTNVKSRERFRSGR